MALIVVTGGARSGKSRWAQHLAAQRATDEHNVTYLATAEVADMEMRLRVAQHRRARPRSWKTIESPTALAATLLRRGKINEKSLIVLDSVAMLIHNLLYGENAIRDLNVNPTALEQGAQAELRAVMRLINERQATIIMVTDEVGGGALPPDTQMRTYRDAVGRINQWLAAQAEEVWLTASGYALPLHEQATRIPPAT